MPKTRRLPDATLVRRSQQGDRRAFAVLTARYDWRLRGLAHALLLDRTEMDTALGIAYVRAWRDIVRINVKDDVGAWLYRVTYNACIDQLRRAGGDDGGAVPHTGVAAGLASLSASDRVAVVLVDREGFTPVSAARILGLSPSTVSTRLDVARRRLAEYAPPPPAGEAPPDGDDGPVDITAAPPPEPGTPDPEVESDVEAPPAVEAHGASRSGTPAPPGPGTPAAPEPAAVPAEPAESAPVELASAEAEPAAESGVPVEPSPEPTDVTVVDVAEPAASAEAEPAAESGVPVEPSSEPVDVTVVDVSVVAAEPAGSADAESADRDLQADVGGNNGSGSEAPADAAPAPARQGNGAHPNGHASAPAANAEASDAESATAADGETGHGDDKGRGRRARRRARYAASHRSSDRPRPAGDDGP